MLAGHGERPPAAPGTRAGDRPSPLRAAQAWSSPGPSPVAAASWPKPHSSPAARPAVAPPPALGPPHPECGALIRPRPPTAPRPRPQCQSTPHLSLAWSSWSSAHAPVLARLSPHGAPPMPTTPPPAGLNPPRLRPCLAAVLPQPRLRPTQNSALANLLSSHASKPGPASNPPQTPPPSGHSRSGAPPYSASVRNHRPPPWNHAQDIFFSGPQASLLSKTLPLGQALATPQPHSTPCNPHL